MDQEHERKSDERFVRLLQVGADIAGSLSAASVGLLVAGPAGALAGGVVGPTISHSIQKIGKEISQRVLGPREEKRVGATILCAAQKVKANIEAGREVRTDGFFDEQVDGRSPADEIVEGAVLVAQRDYEERKIPFYGNLLGNIAFATNIDRAYANFLLKTAEQLSYRQLCLLHIVANCKALKLTHRTVRDGNPNITEGRIVGLQELVGLYNHGLVMDAEGTAWLGISDATVCGRLTEIGTALYDLMDLSMLRASDINTTVNLLTS